MKNGKCDFLCALIPSLCLASRKSGAAEWQMLWIYRNSLFPISPECVAIGAGERIYKDFQRMAFVWGSWWRRSQPRALIRSLMASLSNYYYCWMCAFQYYPLSVIFCREWERERCERHRQERTQWNCYHARCIRKGFNNRVYWPRFVLLFAQFPAIGLAQSPHFGFGHFHGDAGYWWDAMSATTLRAIIEINLRIYLSFNIESK